MSTSTLSSNNNVNGGGEGGGVPFILNTPTEIQQMIMGKLDPVGATLFGLTCQQIKSVYRAVHGPGPATPLDTADASGTKALWQYLEPMTDREPEPLVYDNFEKKLVTPERLDDLIEEREEVRESVRVALEGEYRRLRRERRRFVRGGPTWTRISGEMGEVGEMLDEVEEMERVEHENLMHQMEREEEINDIMMERKHAAIN